MKETKQASGQPEARDVVREMMAAFEAFKGANDARLREIAPAVSLYVNAHNTAARAAYARAGFEQLRKIDVHSHVYEDLPVVVGQTKKSR